MPAFRGNVGLRDKKGVKCRGRWSSGHEAEKRLSIYGKNELEEKKPPSVLQRLIGQFMDPLIYVLLAAGVISVLLGEQGDAAIIAAVVLLNAAVGVAQEGKAQKALESLKQMTKLKAVVKRDGRLLEIDSAELVPGDLVVLSAGQQVPADLRLIFTENLKTQEAALTGESSRWRKTRIFLRENIRRWETGKIWHICLRL